MCVWQGAVFFDTLLQKLQTAFHFKLEDYMDGVAIRARPLRKTVRTPRGLHYPGFSGSTGFSGCTGFSGQWISMLKRWGDTVILVIVFKSEVKHGMYSMLT